MNSSMPKMKMTLAKQAIVHFFQNDYWTNEEVNFLHLFCIRHDSEKIWKLKLRVLTLDNNDLIVAAVLADASPEEFKFLYNKYRLGHSFTKIGLELNVHPNGLQRWRDKFLQEISSLIDFELPVDDIFSRNKVGTLVFTLERLIVFLEEYGKADERTLHSLKVKLSGYQNLLFALKQYSYLDSDSVGCKIIQLKIHNQNISVGELERRSGSSHTTVQNYIHRFQEKFYQSISA